MGSKSWILIGIIFLIILAFIAVLWENVFKYAVLNETAKRTFQSFEQSCKSHDTAAEQRNCMDSVNQMIENFKLNSNP